MDLDSCVLISDVLNIHCGAAQPDSDSTYSSAKAHAIGRTTQNFENVYRYENNWINAEPNDCHFLDALLSPGLLRTGTRELVVPEKRVSQRCQHLTSLAVCCMVTECCALLITSISSLHICMYVCISTVGFLP